jgi:GntR family transcriptional regulator
MGVQPMKDQMDIIDDLVEGIHSSKYAEDDRLPSENELAEYYHVPRLCIRNVYHRLQQLGYCYSIQGKGYFVRSRQIQIPLVLGGHESFSQKMNNLGLNYYSKNIGCTEVAPSEKLNIKLKLKNESRIFEIKRLRYVNQEPIAIHISYVAESTFPDIALEGHRISSMFDYFASKHYTQYPSSQSVLSINFPTKDEREWLCCSNYIPMLTLESSCTDFDSGETLEVTTIIYRSDRFTYLI